MNEKVYLYGMTKAGGIYAMSGVVKLNFKNINSATFYEQGTNFRYKCSKTEGEVLSNRVWYKEANLEAAMRAFMDYEMKKIKKLEGQLSLHKQKRSTLEKWEITKNEGGSLGV